MASNSKSWGFGIYNDKPIYVVLFIARKKDNQDLPNFVERRLSFITTESIHSKTLNTKFHHFCEDGVSGEFCRLYYSVNARNPQAIYKQLIHFLIDEPCFNLCAIPSKIAGIAAKKECALEKKWMFDFDSNDTAKLQEFCNDITDIDKDVEWSMYPTPHGYAVITNRGFDTRKLFEKWTENVTLKKDDLLCVGWWTNLSEYGKINTHPLI